MRDTREKALEKAKQRSKNADSSAAFESERRRAAQARRNEVGSYTGENVHMIPAAGTTSEDTKILRVAAYCRVSTDDIDQVISIELQKNNYRDMIKQNPKWKYVGTYVDDGFSGTNTEHRPGFNMMMRDAMDGKIDLIITKAVSRFARNLIDCINWVRRLQKHDPPIAVFFEQENLNTLDNTSNIILFVLAMVAEEESHMKSEAMLLSLEWRFSRGRFLTPKLLGYDIAEIVDRDGIKKKMLVINEEQAEIVRYMFYSLLNGLSPAEIAENLTAMGLETGGRKRDGTVNTEWSASGVVSTMRNERYCGDVLARKTWTPDFHDHKSKKNDGKKNKYYQPGHHEAIVTRAQWNAAQKILNSGKFNKMHGYQAMQVIEHGALRGYISLNKAWAGFDLNEYFRISSIVMGLETGELEDNLENEYLPEKGHKLMGAIGENGVQRIARQLSEAEQAIKNTLEGSNETEADEDFSHKTEKTKESVASQFQVISGDYFTHAFEPIMTVRRSTIAFNPTCVSKLKNAAEDDIYTELLLNPVMRMLAVRPCDKNHPNAIRWSGKKSCSFGASILCGMLFDMLDWSEDCTYHITASIREKDNERVLFFDLDNAIINKPKRKKNAESLPQVPENSAGESQADSTSRDGNFFFGDEDEEPQSSEDIEAIQQRLTELAELDKVSFGTLLTEYIPSSRLDAIDKDGEWDVMAKATVIGDNHKVDKSIISSIEDRLLEKSIALSEKEESE